MNLRKIKELLRKFKREKSGQVVITTAFLLPALFGTAGLALDYSRISQARTTLTNSLDAAVLAVGKDIANGVVPTGGYEKAFEDFFFANLEGRGIARDDVKLSNFNADEDSGEVTADVNFELPMTFMRVAGYETFDIPVTSSAIFDVDPVEISIMLDTTGSMQGQKLADLQAAATDLVESLLPDNRTRGMRIALVPYAASINAGSFSDEVVIDAGNSRALQDAIDRGILSARDEHGAANSCATERGGAYAATDASPRTAPLGSDRRTEVNGLDCPSARVTPLTNNRGELLNTIDALSAKGATAGHLGVAWSYYTLSEKWRNVVWQGNDRPDPYSSETRKIVVLMTDGEFNTYYHDTTQPGNPGSAVRGVSQSNELAESLCRDMKSPKANGAGFTVYSIAFQAPASAEATLRRCATPDTSTEQFYFSADSGTELRAAFAEIAASIGRLRVTR